MIVIVQKMVVFCEISQKKGQNYFDKKCLAKSKRQGLNKKIKIINKVKMNFKRLIVLTKVKSKYQICVF